jgi:hypothetical protein
MAMDDTEPWISNSCAPPPCGSTWPGPTCCSTRCSILIVAVHLEAVNHCPLSRADLREAVDAASVGERVVIPADGERRRR